MPMQLLDRLCGLRMPLQIDDQDEIHLCDILRNAGLIEAELPSVVWQRDRIVHSGPATVIRVTPKGRCAAGRGPQTGPLRDPSCTTQQAATLRFPADNGSAEAAAMRRAGFPVDAPGGAGTPA